MLLLRRRLDDQVQVPFVCKEAGEEEDAADALEE
jgi:hypothetical protein